MVAVSRIIPVVLILTTLVHPVVSEKSEKNDRPKCPQVSPPPFLGQSDTCCSGDDMTFALAKSAASAARNPSNSPSKRTTDNGTAAFEQNLASEANYVHEVVCELALAMILVFSVVHFL